MMIDNSTWLWYMQFDHLNFDNLSFLASKRMVGGLPSIRNFGRICNMCILKKQHRDADVLQTDKSWRVGMPLEIIYSNLCTMKVPSNGGYRYLY